MLAEFNNRLFSKFCLLQVYVSQLDQSNDKKLKTALEVDEYTSECIEICWFMVVCT